MTLIVLPGVQHRADDFPLDAGLMAALRHAEENHFWHRQRNAWIRRALRDRGSVPGASVLEVGCGSGTVARNLFSAGYQVTGIDTAEALVRKAEERCPGACFVVGNVGQLPVELRGPYDIVGLFDVLEHVDEPESLLREACRWLSPGGIVIATVPARRELFGLVDSLSGHKRRYELGELANLLSKAGLEDVDERGFFRALVPIFRFVRRKRSVEDAKIDSVKSSRLMKDNLRVPPLPINFAFDLLCMVERNLLWSKGQDSAGTSLLATARRSPRSEVPPLSSSDSFEVKAPPDDSSRARE